MRLVFIYGLPATGKLTVARELASLTGYKLFHNHLVVDLLLSTFDFGSAPFVELREQIWLLVFEQACRSEVPGLIFTFNPESTVRAGFVRETVKTIARCGGQLDFVELTCPFDELRRRIDSPSRLLYRKLSSLSRFDELHAQGAFDASQMPRAALTIDTSRCEPAGAAEQIAALLKLPGAGLAAG